MHIKDEGQCIVTNIELSDQSVTVKIVKSMRLIPTAATSLD